METTMIGKVPWEKGARFEATERFELDARPEAVFPLLCPVREYDWFPEWRCLMVYSESGIAERDAMFLTRSPDGATEVEWTTRFTVAAKAAEGVAAGFTGESNSDFLARRREEMEHYLKRGGMFGG